MRVHAFAARNAAASPSKVSACRCAQRSPGPSNRALQAKLVVGRQDDPLEHEADRAAERVLAGSGAGALGTCAACAAEERETLRRQPVEEEDEEEIQAKAEPGGLHGAGAEAAAAAVAGGGQPLPSALRAYFEPRFGHGLADVRVHAHARAGAAAHAIGARAYTLGRDAAFAPGAWAPGTRDGRRLIAHELAHVVQQRGGSGEGVVRRAPDGSRVQGRGGEVTQTTPAESGGVAGPGLPPEGIPKNCFEGLFAPPPNSALPAFEGGRALAISWTRSAQSVLKKHREGTASREESALARKTFSALFGDPGAFAGMKKVAQDGVPRPRVSQTAEDVVLRTVDNLAEALPKLRPARFQAPQSPRPGVGYGPAKSAEQRAKVATEGIPVFCGKITTDDDCERLTANAFFSARENAVAVCDPFFSGANRNRAATLIHELVHALNQPLENDVYTFSRLFGVLQAAPGTLGRPGGFALYNPDSITEFIRILAEVGATGQDLGPTKTKPTGDIFEGFGERETEVELALAFAHERALQAQDTMRDLVLGLHELRTIVVGRSGGSSSSSQTWGSERDRLIGCRIQRAFENTDSRVADLGDPCAGGTHIGPDGVALIEQLQSTFSDIGQAFSTALTVRLQPAAGADMPVLWLPGPPTTLLVDETFFKLGPPARARAILLGMEKRSIPIPAGIASAPPIAAQAGVVDNVTSAHVELMDFFLAQVFPVAVGPGG